MGRSWILCIPKIALCGALTIGVDISEPKTPPLVIVKVPPVRSSMAIVPSRARLAYSPTSFSMLAKLFTSASRTTGTISPRSVETATPMS